MSQSTMLPKGWGLARIGEITSKCEQSKPANEVEFIYVDIGSIDRDLKRITEPQRLIGKDAPSRARKIINTGDVLVSLTRPNLNAVALVSGEFDNQIASTGFEVIKPVKVDSGYIFAIVRSKAFIDSISGKVRGALYPAAKSDDVREYQFPLPPLAEQQQIADQLDELLAQVDTLKTRLDIIPKILKRFRQSVLNAAVSGKVTAEWRKANQIKDWQFAQLCELNIDVQIGPFGSLLHKSDYIEGGIPLINPMHINDGKIIPSEFMTVTLVKAAELQRYNLQIGDIVLGRRGEMGRAAVVNKDGLICGTGSLYLRPNLNNFEPIFIWLVLSASETIKYLEENSVGTTVVNLNQKILKNLPFPKVELEEQTEIVIRVEQLFAYADQIEQRVKDAQARVNHLTQSILAKAFRGELTADWREQNPDLISGKTTQ